MKLYEVPNNSKVILETGEEYNFSHVDGVYSFCTDDNHNVVHLPAWTEVKVKKDATTKTTRTT